MAKKKVTAKNLNTVLDNIKKQSAQDTWVRDGYIAALNEMLDNLYAEDFFGTEGQIDPRGDQRD